MAKTKAAKKIKVDFTDEDAVLEAVAKDAGFDPDDDCRIEEDRGLTGFGEGTVYRITCGSEEFCAVEDVDTAYKLALAVVKQDLESEPEIFNKDFIERHIDTDKLRRELQRDVQDMAQEDLEETLRSGSQRGIREFWDQAERFNMDAPEEDDDGDLPAPEDTDVETLAEKIAEDRLEEPMDYLNDIYGDEAAELAIKIAGIDIDAASEDAVDTDGWEHFLARYDGNSHELSGLVYWRDN